MSILVTLIALYLLGSSCLALIKLTPIVFAILRFKFDLGKAGLCIQEKSPIVSSFLITLDTCNTTIKALCALPVIGSIFLAVWFIWLWIEGAVTVKVILTYFVLTCLFSGITLVVLKLIVNKKGQ